MCHAPCTLNTFFVDLEKEYAHCSLSRYNHPFPMALKSRCLDIFILFQWHSKVVVQIYSSFSNGTQKSLSRYIHPFPMALKRRCLDYPPSLVSLSRLSPPSLSRLSPPSLVSLSRLSLHSIVSLSRLSPPSLSRLSPPSLSRLSPHSIVSL